MTNFESADLFAIRCLGFGSVDSSGSSVSHGYNESDVTLLSLRIVR